MPGPVPGIHVFDTPKQDVDGRDKPGHDERTAIAFAAEITSLSLTLIPA